VTFDIDANGILNVGAKDKATGKEQSIVIKASSGLSDAEIQQMIKDAEANAEADRQFAEVVGARNTLEGLIHATQKTLKDAGDKATADEKSKIEAAVKEAEEVVKSEDLAKIQAATEKLTEASSSLAQKLYAEQQAGAQAGAQQAGGSSKAADDGVVDAEFEEVKDDK
jgi:molecular chaperone DnaK